MTEIFIPNIIEYSLCIEAGNINKNINNIIKKKLRDEIEGKCIKEGYVKKKSIKILNRSLGEVLASHFNGSILYHIKLKLEVCNPLEGTIIKGIIKNINKMGILAESGDGDPPPLSILLAKQHHVDNTAFENLQLGDEISIKIIGKRFEFGDVQINIIGILETDPKKDPETAEELVSL